MTAGILILAAIFALALYLWLSTGDNQYRVEALRRILYGVPFLLLMLLFGGIIGAVIITTFVLDVTFQLAAGREGWTPGGHVERLERWRRDNMLWLQTGKGDFQWLP